MNVLDDTSCQDKDYNIDAGQLELDDLSGFGQLHDLASENP